MLVPALATAHVERASYWPDPAPDNSVSPPAGGAVPEARSLFTALDTGAPGDTHVVCQGDVAAPPTGLPAAPSRVKLDRLHRRAHRGKRARRNYRREKKRYLAAVALYHQQYGAILAQYRQQLLKNDSMAALQSGIGKARTDGYKLRPSAETIVISQAQADQLLEFNLKLVQQCAFDSIQDAVNASGNNDRVVVMPGVYTEPESRAAPTQDPACADLKEQNDRPGGTGALSYAYQYTCPNDQNLIAVMGRVPNHAAVPQPPRDDRHGIPDEGACIRCNLQLEGSGPSPDDVIVDGGNVNSGNGPPIEAVKDVTIRADRADGFVLQNMTVRHASEHNIYIPETDGALLQRFKTFYNEEYGVLTFVSDHHLIQDCEASGSGDASIYPGSSADPAPAERFSTEIRRCDMHHSAAGYSGTAASAVHFHHNEVYDNALGFTTDVFTAAGHPGFPQHGDLIENNNFHSNNFNPYVAGSDVEPTIPVPVGTGAWIAGGNNNELRNNHFWDNWRRGTMVFTVPDQFVCGDNALAGGNHQHGCQEGGGLSTSFDNRHHDNVMGRRPDGTADPNGLDFWWDQYPNQVQHDPPTTTGNCWFDNTGKDGTAASVTSDPPAPLLPSNCDLSLGLAGGPQETELLSCFAAFTEGVGECSWFTTPPEPQP
jgi:hypothetical protein